jgi:hypothetical protein
MNCAFVRLAKNGDRSATAIMPVSRDQVRSFSCINRSRLFLVPVFWCEPSPQRSYWGTEGRIGKREYGRYCQK